MTVPRLEALADAIMAFEGWHVGDRPYRNRNPGDLRKGRFQLGEDRDGYAIFSGLSVGYQALLTDLRDKCTGKTVTCLGTTSTLQDLVDVWAPAADHNEPLRYAAFVARYVSAGLGLNIDISTTLDFFLADEVKL